MTHKSYEIKCLKCGKVIGYTPDKNDKLEVDGCLYCYD